jgi:hypothetical protein
MTNQLNKIFEDLENFRDFCVQYGYRFDEANLYNMRQYSFQQFMKYASGKYPKNMWLEDAKKYEDSLNQYQ